ncbi:thioesterase II family protein [Micromonospora sp. SL1-18]|uniref:thioesterase II family protein n=1 Tax=Micromonospora sp. SL1-18 TaxID=3399128 RepID=UPI003A4D3129
MDALAGRRAQWGVVWQRAPEAQLRLFCLPHTGGGAAVYRWWAQQLAPAVEVVAIRLPGRETRLREAPYARLADLAPALVDAVEPWLDRPHAWLGHSMGALIAFEACHLLRHRDLPQPRRLFVTGRRAPHLADREPPVHDAPAPNLVARLRALGGTPREVLEDDATMSALLPMLRADYAVSETYRWRSAPALDCPISVLGGADDPLTTVDELQAWRRHTTTECTVRLFAGGHFFLHEARARILPAIRADLTFACPSAAGRPAAPGPSVTSGLAGTTPSGRLP